MKVSKLLLLFRTIKYLKIKQVFYLFFKRIRRPKPLKSYQANLPKPKIRKVEFPHFTSNRIKILGQGFQFEILNQIKEYPHQIDWNEMEFGKLWNYNLQYLDFINQEDISQQVRLEIILDFYENLWGGKVILEPYPASIRIFNLIKFLTSNNIPDNHEQLILKFLIAEKVFLFRNLEYHLYGNHILENAFSLFAGGIFFRDQPTIKESRKLLIQQLNEQILEDGGHFERSPMYHKIILSRILDLINFTRRYQADKEIIAILESTSKKMLGWLKEMTFGLGETPMLKDFAPGMAPKSEDLFSYVDHLGLEYGTGKLKDSGYRRFSFKEYTAFVDAGQIGPDYIPGHAHADSLNFVVYYNSIPFIIDPGVTTYENGQRRALERSTRHHNTVEINGENSTEVWHSFRVGGRARVRTTDERADFIRLEHNGYRKFGSIHQRSIKFTDGQMEISDQLVGSATKGKSFLHFSQEFTPRIIENKIIFSESKVVIHISGNSNCEIIPFKYSGGFNNLKESFKLAIDFQKDLTLRIIF